MCSSGIIICPVRGDALTIRPASGRVAEWLKALDSKSSVVVRLPWVQIPPLPPKFFCCLSFSSFAVLIAAVITPDRKRAAGVRHVRVRTGVLALLSLFAITSSGASFEQAHAILQEHCFKCHSHSAEKIKGGLVLDSLDGMLTGGDTGPAIVPGDMQKS